MITHLKRPRSCEVSVNWDNKKKKKTFLYQQQFNGFLFDEIRADNTPNQRAKSYWNYFKEYIRPSSGLHFIVTNLNFNYDNIPPTRPFQTITGESQGGRLQKLITRKIKYVTK